MNKDQFALITKEINQLKYRMILCLAGMLTLSGFGWGVCLGMLLR